MMVFSGYPANTSGARRYSLSRDGRNLQLSPHFRLWEFASRDGADTVYVWPQLVALLEIIRLHFEGPLIITSGYRSAEHNKKVGGALQSRHRFGMAADIVHGSATPSQIAAVARKYKVGGLKAYSGFTHVDIQGVNRRW